MFRDNWKTGIGILILVGLIIIVFCQKNMKLSDRIQASSVIALAFITFFYAVQTQNLVKEERKSLDEEKNKRKAEYGEKRIKEFLQPIDDHLADFTIRLSGINNLNTPLISKYDNRLAPAWDILIKLEKYFSENYFMSDNLLYVRWQDFCNKTMISWPTIEKQEKDYVINWMNKVLNEANQIRISVISEILEISKHIQKTYGYYMEDYEDKKEFLNKIIKNSQVHLI